MTKEQYRRLIILSFQEGFDDAIEGELNRPMDEQGDHMLALAYAHGFTLGREISLTTTPKLDRIQ
jgi:hypothetical protein